MSKKLWLLFILPLFLFSCNNKKLNQENSQLKKNIRELKQTIHLIKQGNQHMQFLINQMEGVKARIVTNMGNIELSFFPKDAPLTCFAFITRAEGGFYNNTLFHRVIPGFMIQGGDPLTKTNDTALYGTGGPLVAIPHEFNKHKHVRGVLSMARVADVSKGAGSQFFIMHADAPQLDGQYTVFGQVTKGLEVVDKIAGLKRNNRDMPLSPARIEKIEVYR